ncbi:MAG: serine/threonine protein kinase [Candidatus Competibacteraceae bacterium]|nr:serine/threonine protein kinase [Candidatus Competibacteraceae bacterium]MBK8895874.1 serine/threonine protein kinase [Candidatus Competibacteraceae bacterium]MBK9953098.1 serine/threonine protein kinase [Candidatus Competibacteraceae bacterium]
MVDDSGDISKTRPPRIGRYRLTKTLGRGAMGVVYLGYDEAIDRQVAIKTIHRTLLESDDGAGWLERFRREVRAAGRCLHPNIVTVFEYGEENGIPYIVMEYVQGRELRDYLKERQPLPLANAVAVAVQVLHALDHAHHCGVVHRDIKPGNIILLAGGQLKVSDFGIARMETISGLTQHGMTVGTPAYMAPEQFKGLEADRRADLYAVGVVLFETLTGVRPFMGRGASDLMYKVLHEPPPRVTLINPRLPVELDGALEKALAKSPEQRYQNANEFIAALENMRLVEREIAADGSTLIRVAPVQAPEPPAPDTPAGWDPALLAQAERFLTEILGPVAKVLVRRAALQAGSPAELVQQLMALVPGEPQRLLFQRRMRGVMSGTLSGSVSRVTTAGTSAPASQMSGSLGSFEQPLLETARQDLALYLGPIAKVLVKQAAAKAQTPQELYQKLAESIPTAADRAAFLKRAPALTG